MKNNETKEVRYINRKLISHRLIKDDIISSWIEQYIKTFYNKVEEVRCVSYHSDKIWVYLNNDRYPIVQEMRKISTRQFKKFCKTRKLMDSYTNYVNHLNYDDRINIDTRQSKYRAYCEENFLGPDVRDFKKQAKLTKEQMSQNYMNGLVIFDYLTNVFQNALKAKKKSVEVPFSDIETIAKNTNALDIAYDMIGTMKVKIQYNENSVLFTF